MDRGDQRGRTGRGLRRGAGPGRERAAVRLPLGVEPRRTAAVARGHRRLDPLQQQGRLSELHGVRLPVRRRAGQGDRAHGPAEQPLRPHRAHPASAARQPRLAVQGPGRCRRDHRRDRPQQHRARDGHALRLGPRPRHPCREGLVEGRPGVRHTLGGGLAPPLRRAVHQGRGPESRQAHDPHRPQQVQRLGRLEHAQPHRRPGEADGAHPRRVERDDLRLGEGPPVQLRRHLPRVQRPHR